MKPTPRDTELLRYVFTCAIRDREAFAEANDHDAECAVVAAEARKDIARFHILRGKLLHAPVRCPRCHRKAPNQSGCALCNPEGIPETVK